MKHSWFKQWGWMYYPISWQGVGVTALALLFCAQVFIAVDSRSHSVSDTLYEIFPYWVPALGILLWVASKTARK